MDPSQISPAHTRSKTRALGKAKIHKKDKGKDKVADVPLDDSADSHPPSGSPGVGGGVVEVQSDGGSSVVSDRDVEDLVQVEDQALPPGGSPEVPDIHMHPLGQGVQQDYIPHGSNTQTRSLVTATRSMR